MGLPSYYIGLDFSQLSGINNRGIASTIQTVGEKTDAKMYSLSFNVSGVRENDIAVVVKEGQLIIELEKEYDPTAVAHTNWDKSYGIFTRYIDLPEDADISSLKKSVADGVLTVELARSSSVKKAPAKPKRQPEATL